MLINFLGLWNCESSLNLINYKVELSNQGSAGFMSKSVLKKASLYPDFVYLPKVQCHVNTRPVYTAYILTSSHSYGTIYLS